MRADVFISYSREDKDRVVELAQKLREAGVSLWIDQGGIDGAAMWSEEIVNALENSKVLMLMVSENAVTSHNVIKEVTIASERKGLILPIHLEPTRIPAALKYALAGIQHIEYFQGDPSENLRTIIRSLERIGVTVGPPEVGVAFASTSAPTQAHSMHSDFSAHASKLAPTLELRRAIAVLPFDNVSPDKETDYFSDGLTEELISSLSKVSGIDTVSRITCMQYKGTKKDLPTIGKELGTRYLMMGSVRKFQDNLRINAQLVDVQTDRQLWSETYKGKLDDIFDIQEKVAEQIADALKLKLSINEKVALTKRSTDDAQAYDLYLRGKEYLYQLTKKSVEYSIQLFERAIELDSRYAAAYAASSIAHGMLYGLFKRDERLRDQGQELGLKALMYDSASAEAYTAVSLSYYYRLMYDEAISAGQTAISLDSDNFLPYWLVGRVYFSMGMNDEAVAALERSLELERTFYTTYNDLGLAYTALGRTEDSSRTFQKLHELLPTHLLKYPDDNRARLFYANRLVAIGRSEQAIAELYHALEKSSDDALLLYNAACLYANLGEIKQAVHTLQAAFKAGYEYADWIKRDSDLDPIRSDPEYIELMKDK